MARKTPPHKTCPSMTQAEFRSMIISALRMKSRWWKPAEAALKKACVGRKESRITGFLSKHYTCNNCGNHFPQAHVQVDHKYPVIDPFIGFTTWDDYIDRMFCSEDDFQVLCKPCHDEKTMQEKEIRRINKID